MGTKVGTSVDGVNSAEGKDLKPFDHFCPLMTTVSNSMRLNYWKANCAIRNQMKIHHKTCYPHCKMIEMNKVGKKPNINEVIELGKKWYAMHRKGLLQRDIALKENVSDSTVSRYISLYLNTSNVKSKQSFYQINLQNAKKWYKMRNNEGMSVKEISEIYAVSKTTIRKYLTALDVKAHRKKSFKKSKTK